LDPLANNNVAQRHLWLLEVAPGATAEVAFDFTGVPGGSGAVSFQVDSAGLPQGTVISPLTLVPGLSPGPSGPPRGPGEPADTEAPPPYGDLRESRGIVEEAVLGAITGGIMLQAGERRRAGLQVTLSPTAQPGARYTLGIAQLQGGTIAGKLSVQISVVSGA
jgi:hypothetical protein